MTLLATAHPVSVYMAYYRYYNMSRAMALNLVFMLFAYFCAHVMVTMVVTMVVFFRSIPFRHRTSARVFLGRRIHISRHLDRRY